MDKMKEIKISSTQIPEKIEISIKDLRDPTHSEFEDFDDIVYHVNKAIELNGLRYYSDHIFKDIYKQEHNKKPVSLINHLYYLLGNAKGVVKFRYKHSKSSFSRYKTHNYETLDLLRKKVYLKHKGKVYKGSNGIRRIEVIESVNALCKDEKNPKVLEVGCGSGVNIYLLHALNPNIEIHGFEYTNSRLASAIVNLFYTPICKNLFLADVCNIRLPDNSFDVVYSNHVLEQLGQERAEIALNEMWRVCRKGIVLSEPSVTGANIYEKWRMNTLGYCKDLHKVAKDLSKADILTYKEDKYRAYPNTSHHLVVKKEA